MSLSMSHNSTRPDQTVDVSNIVSSAIRDAQMALPNEGPRMSRRELLSMIYAIKSLLADTYIHFNARALPNELPHELLAIIFQHVLPSKATISFPAIENDGYRPAICALTLITHVCRLWRDVAFGTPALWTRIDARAYPADELRRIMQRSDPLLLSVFLGKIDERTVSEKSMLLRSLSRLHRLDFDVKAPTPSVVEKLLSFDGSTLQCLTVSSSIVKGWRRINGDNLNHTICILQGRAHNLKALAIVPSLGWIPANHFPCLTHLYISFATESTEPPDPKNILSLLRNTPRLEIVHLHHLDAWEDLPFNEPSEPLRVELPHLRSLVVTVSAYHLVIDTLQCLSLPSSVFIRLDDLFVPYHREDPRPIPGDLAPLHTVTGMELAVKDEILFLVVEGPSSGVWLRVRHVGTEGWHLWLRDLRDMLPLGNLVSLHADVYDPILPSILGDMLQLSELSVQLAEDETWLGQGVGPLVRSLCNLLSRSQPVICPSLRLLALEWPGNMPESEDLGVPHIIAILAKRSQIGYPIRRLVVQAIPIQFGTVQPTHFSEQLLPLAEHVEEYEECLDPGAHACAFEMRDMWNIEGAEDYWVVDEKQRPRYTKPRSFDYSDSGGCQAF